MCVFCNCLALHCVAQLQKELEISTASAGEAAELLDTSISKASAETLEVGQVLMAVKNLLQRCTSKQHDPLHNGSACSRDARCSQYYRTTFANWTFCIAVGSRGVRRTALLDEGDVDAHPLASAAVCATTTADILARCETGFVKAAP